MWDTCKPQRNYTSIHHHHDPGPDHGHHEDDYHHDHDYDHHRYHQSHHHRNHHHDNHHHSRHHHHDHDHGHHHLDQLTIIDFAEPFTCIVSRADKMMKLWESTIDDHSQSFLLWKNYLTFCQSNFTTFTVSNMRSKYADAISGLQSAKKKQIRGNYPNFRLVPGEGNNDNGDGAMIMRWINKFATADPTKAEALDLQLLGLFYSACTMEKKSGYIEKAIGSFQVSSCYYHEHHRHHHHPPSTVSDHQNDHHHYHYHHTTW